MAKNIKVDDKRYRYFITDKDRAKRIFAKETSVILEHLAKDTQHKLVTLNRKWYKTGGQPTAYNRVEDSNKTGGSILKNNGYKIIQGNDENILHVYYDSHVTSKDNPPFGGSTFGRGHEYMENGKKARIWTSHGVNEKQSLSFEGYVDFIETGGSDWRNLGNSLFYNSGMNPTKKATHATEKLRDWYYNTAMTSAMRNQLYDAAKTSLIMSFK